MLAANLFAARFNVRGQFIRAWNFNSPTMDTRGVAIIDSMMNLPLLYWASEESGDPRFRLLAEAHARLRASSFAQTGPSATWWSSTHTGQKLRHGGQGHAPGSWARGTAWALHGFALSYRYTGEARYLETAERARFLPRHAWRRNRAVLGFPRTGGASGGVGFVRCCDCGERSAELAKLSPRGEEYAAAGERIVRGLHERYSSGESAAEEGLIMQGTVHYPEGRGLNVPIIYGDYFYMEALAKLRGRPGLF